MSNENWNDPANPPSQPQQPQGQQPSAPEPQAPPTTPENETTGTGSYSSPNYTTPSYTPPSYGTPEGGEHGSATSTPPGYTAPDSTPAQGASSPYGSTPSYGTPGQATPSYGAPAGGGYTPPESAQPYGTTPTPAAPGQATPSYGTPAGGYTPPASSPYGSTPSYGSSAGSYGSAPEAGSSSGYTDPNQSYGATGGYGQSQPSQYGTTGYGQTAEGYQDPNSTYGATPSPTYGAGYPGSNLSPYGYDSGYANPAPELASFGNRALGWLIDWVAPGFVAAILSSIVAGILNTSALSWLFSLLALAFMLWNSGYVAGTTGYSLGRRVAKNKLVSEATGQPIGVGAGIGRAAIDIVAGWLCGIGAVVNWLFPLWDSKHQTIADKIVKSVVISDPNAGQAPLR